MHFLTLNVQTTVFSPCLKTNRLLLFRLDAHWIISNFSRNTAGATQATLDWYSKVTSPHTRRDSKHLL